MPTKDKHSSLFGQIIWYVIFRILGANAIKLFVTYRQAE